MSVSVVPATTDVAGLPGGVATPRRPVEGPRPTRSGGSPLPRRLDAEHGLRLEASGGGCRTSPRPRVEDTRTGERWRRGRGCGRRRARRRVRRHQRLPRLVELRCGTGGHPRHATCHGGGGGGGLHQPGAGPRWYGRGRHGRWTHQRGDGRHGQDPVTGASRRRDLEPGDLVVGVAVVVLTRARRRARRGGDGCRWRRRHSLGRCRRLASGGGGRSARRPRGLSSGGRVGRLVGGACRCLEPSPGSARGDAPPLARRVG
jgi:hypothetical protein